MADKSISEKVSVRFYKDREVRAVWDEEHQKWWFSVLDLIGVLNEQDDHQKNRNYWKYLKAKWKKQNSELGSVTTQLKLKASDGKRYKTDVLDSDGVKQLAQNFPNNKALEFLDWFTYSDNTIDGQSRKKAYTLFESNLINAIEVGTVKGFPADPCLSFRWALRLCRKDTYSQYCQRWLPVCHGPVSSTNTC